MQNLDSGSQFWRMTFYMSAFHTKQPKNSRRSSTCNVLSYISEHLYHHYLNQKITVQEFIKFVQYEKKYKYLGIVWNAVSEVWLKDTLTFKQNQIMPICSFKSRPSH